MSKEPDKQIISASEMLPNHIYIVPLQGRPIFPGIFTPIMIVSPEDIAIVDKAMETDNVIGLVLTTDPNTMTPKQDELYRIGTVARIVKRINKDGAVTIFISTHLRFRIKKFRNNESPYLALVEYLNDETEENDRDIKALTRALLAEMKQISEDNPLFSEEMRLNMVNIDIPGKIADFITGILNINRDKQQEILETLDIKSRMEKVLLHIKKEHELSMIQRRIVGEMNEKIEKSQREYFLREELKAIKNELGEPTDARSSEFQKFKEALNAFKFKGEILEQVNRELDKFQLMEPSTSEYIVTRNYLDWIIFPALDGTGSR